MKPALETVESSAIRALSFYLATDHVGVENSFLVIWFNNGYIYEYEGVPERVYHALRSDSSVGRAYNSSVKGKFDLAGKFAV